MKLEILEKGVRRYQRLQYCQEQIKFLRDLKLAATLSSDDDGKKRLYYLNNEFQLKIKSEGRKQKYGICCADLTEKVVQKYDDFIQEFIHHYELEIERLHYDIETLPG